MFLLWSHGFSMCSLQINVLFVLMRVEISLFSSSMLESCGVFLLVRFLLFGTLVGVSVFSAMWLELESVSEISSPRWSSV